MSARVTRATRAAEAAGIDFGVHEYEHDAKAASYGLEAAELLGLDPQRVFKTLAADLNGAGLAVVGATFHRSSVVGAPERSLSRARPGLGLRRAWRSRRPAPP